MNAGREDAGAPRSLHRIWCISLATLVALVALSWILGSKITPVPGGLVLGYLQRNTFRHRESPPDLPWWSVTSRWAEWLNRRTLNEGSRSGAERFARNAFPGKFPRVNLPPAALPVSADMRPKLFAPVETYRALAITLPVELVNELGRDWCVIGTGTNYFYRTSSQSEQIVLPGIPASIPTLRLHFEAKSSWGAWHSISEVLEIDPASFSAVEQERVVRINKRDLAIRLRVPDQNEINSGREESVSTSTGTVPGDELERWYRTLDPKSMTADDLQIHGDGEDLVVLIVGDSALMGNVHCQATAGGDPIGVYHPTLPLLVAMTPGYSSVQVSGRSTKEKPVLRYDILACSGTRDATTRRAVLRLIDPLYGDRGPVTMPREREQMIQLLHWIATALGARFELADLQGVQSPELRAIIEELAKRP